MSSPDSSTRISVSEDRLRALLAEFKLDLFGELRKYATQASLDALASTVAATTGRVQTLEDRRVTRDEFHAVKSDIATLQLWRAGQAAMSGLKRWQVTVALGVIGIAAGLIGSIATLIWLNH